MTGDYVLAANHLEGQRIRFLQFLESLELRLLNTWAPSAAVAGEAVGEWTFQSDGAGVQSQIDFVGASGGVIGEALGSWAGWAAGLETGSLTFLRE